MKKNILLLALMLMSLLGRSQNANVTVENFTDFDVRVVMYGYAPQTCPGSCDSTYITNDIFVPDSAYHAASTVRGPYNPCDIETGVGWDSVLCGPSFCTTIPPDFNWTMAKVSLFVPATNILCTAFLTVFPVYVSPKQPTCSPATGPVAGPFPLILYPPPPSHDLTISWISAGGSWADVKIYIYQAP